MRSIYFPRYQQRFLRMGDVGSHPQFRHLEFPPEGFYFDSRPMGVVEWLRALPAALRTAWKSGSELYRYARSRGLSITEVLKFVWSRGTSLVPAPAGSKVTFLPSFPFTHQNEKWFLEIEDVTTLFRPYVLNGGTETVRLKDLEGFSLVKQMLESKNCLGILTHVKSTQESISKIFDSEVIDSKTRHLAAPYIPSIKVNERDLNRLRSTNEFQFFFNNSWHQDPLNFYLRGGISILEAFEQAFSEGLPVRLILRSEIPDELRERFAKLLRHSQVEFVNRFLTGPEYIRILRQSHYFLLPSARLHVVSLMESQYYGAVPIVSDGWGIEEYVSPDCGYILSGVKGKVSWVDETGGELRENYQPMRQSPGLLTAQLIRTIRSAVNGHDHAAMALNGHRHVRDQMSIEQFNPEFSNFLKEGYCRLDNQ